MIWYLISYIVPVNAKVARKSQFLLQEERRTRNGQLQWLQFCKVYNLFKLNEEIFMMEANTNLLLSSPDWEQTGLGNVVTPTKSSKTVSKYSLKKHDDVVPANLMSSAFGAYMIAMRGGIDLFYFEQGQTEAFVNPLVETMFGKCDEHNWDVRRKQLMEDTKIIAVIPRRMSLRCDESQYETSGSNPKNKRKKHYFVRYDPNGCSKEEKKLAKSC